ncbi:hypothetical protein [Endozoicomonas sp. YOMI1]|uniref:hypothetical protein n=1 Tax=Endozoicomonas sp. YOMI1 TaxID=2828739 RepID=UPI0021489241|nr:hypothetical protein [Endozoicomonas sp. YOMI1]
MFNHGLWIFRTNQNHQPFGGAPCSDEEHDTEHTAFAHPYLRLIELQVTKQVDSKDLLSIAHPH